MLESIRYIRRETIFLVIVIFALCHLIGSSPYLQLLPVFTESILKVSATKLGLLSSVAYVGSMVSSIVLASLPGRRRGLLLLISGIIPALAIIVFALSHWWYLSMAMVLFAAVGTNIHATITPTMIQTYAEPNYRARVQGLVYTAMGLGGLSSFFAGALAEAIGLQWAVGGIAGFLLVSTIAIWVFYPRLRKLE